MESPNRIEKSMIGKKGKIGPVPVTLEDVSQVSPLEHKTR